MRWSFGSTPSQVRTTMRAPAGISFGIGIISPSNRRSSTDSLSERYWDSIVGLLSSCAGISVSIGEWTHNGKKFMDSGLLLSSGKADRHAVR